MPNIWNAKWVVDEKNILDNVMVVQTFPKVVLTCMECCIVNSTYKKLRLIEQ